MPAKAGIQRGCPLLRDQIEGKVVWIPAPGFRGGRFRGNDSRSGWARNAFIAYHHICTKRI
jgi:hypothetical protein